MAVGTVNAWRRRRGRVLAERIRQEAARLGRPLRVLDAGGRRDYWDNIGFDGIGSITLINIEAAELDRPTDRQDLFHDLAGDVRDLSGHAAGAFDLYHSNSVIEHVGGWRDMAAMAHEARRVGRIGWIQTPAWSFPVEPHFRLPCMHWFGAPARAALLAYARHYRHMDWAARREHAERINLLGATDLKALFPGCAIARERVPITKSYIVSW